MIQDKRGNPQIGRVWSAEPVIFWLCAFSAMSLSSDIAIRASWTS
jgi:hypothetical protein